VLGGSVDEFQGDKLEATAFETADDVANEAPLNTIGLER